MLYKESLDEILSEPYDFNLVKPCVESKVFGIGVEAFSGAGGQSPVAGIVGSFSNEDLGAERRLVAIVGIYYF